MEEFVKINWGIKDLSELEQNNKFLDDELVKNSYIFTQFKKPLVVKKQTQNKKQAEVPKHNLPSLQEHNVKSALTKQQHQKCLGALQLMHSGKGLQNLSPTHQHYIETYKKLQSAIVQENAKYLEFAKQCWPKTQNKVLGVKKTMRTYTKNRMQKLWTRYLNLVNLYKEIKTISLSYSEEEIPIEVTHLQNVLEIGRLAKFSAPTLMSTFTLEVNTLPSCSDEVYNSKQPVSKDENIKDIIASNNVDVVISSSGLKRLIDNSDYNCSWNIPFSVKEVEINTGNQQVIKKRIVFIDKTLPKTAINNVDIKEKCHKLLVKTNFCKYEAFSFPKCEDLSNEENDSTNKILHNVSYRIWNFGQKDEQCELMKSKVKNSDINLLVRCKLDACETAENGTLQPVTVVPKLEYQLEFGGNIPTKSELAKEWSSLFFRPYSCLYRVRIDSFTSKVVLIEQCNMQKINTEAFTHYNYKPHLGLGILYKVFQEMIKLDIGNYLLHHIPKHGPFATILKETNEKRTDTYDLHNEFGKCSVNKNTSKQWCSIDVNLILPAHVNYQRMPGLFKPFERCNLKRKKKGKNSKKKKKQQ